MRRIKSISDEDLGTLIKCISEHNSLFSKKALDIIINVVTDKKETLELRTLIHLIWEFTKIDIT